MLAGTAAGLAGLDPADDRAAQLGVRDRKPLEQLARLGLSVLRQPEEHVLRPHVRRADLARLLIGGQQGGLRVRRKRRRDVGALLLVGLVLDLRCDRGGVGSDLLQHVSDDLVLGRGPEEVGGVDIQAPPLHRLLSSALEQLPGRVAEVLGDVDLLGRPARPRGGCATVGTGATPAEGAVAEEVGEELVEEAAPAAEGRSRRSAALTLELPEVLFADGDRSLFAVLSDPNRGNGGPTPVDLAHRGGHGVLLPAGAPTRKRWAPRRPPRWKDRVPEGVPV